MVIKIASYILAGSVATLGIARIAGLENRWEHKFGHERRVMVRVHHEGDFEARERRDRRGPRPRRNLEGTYNFEAKGKPGGVISWSANVQLDLLADNRYELRVMTDIDGQAESETSGGTYTIRGDRLILSAPGDSDATEFLIDGDQLRFEADWSERLTLKALGLDNAALVRIRN